MNKKERRMFNHTVLSTDDGDLSIEESYYSTSPLGKRELRVYMVCCCGGIVDCFEDKKSARKCFDEIYEKLDWMRGIK